MTNPFRLDSTRLVSIRSRLSRRRLAWVLRRLPPSPVNDTAALRLVILCGTRDCAVAVAAVRSLLVHLPPGAVALTVHDDGSLSGPQHQQLRHHFPGSVLIERQRADREVGAWLTARAMRNVAAFRAKHPVNLKLTDFAYFHSGRRILQLDSDVLFYQTPEALLGQWAAPSGAVFNVDRGPALAYAHGDMAGYSGGDIDPLFNGGLVALNASRDLLPLTEAVLAARLPLHNVWTEEQTLLAIFLRRSGAMDRLPPSYDVSCSEWSELKFAPKPPLVCQHYCAWSRLLFHADACRLLTGRPVPHSNWLLQRFLVARLAQPPPAARGALTRH